MSVNLDQPSRWKADISRSVDMYNEWFMKFAPSAFRTTRIQTTRDVEAALHLTGNLTNIQPVVLRKNPEILPTLRMSTCPPLAVDRLIGLAGVPSSMVKRMEEKKRLPLRMTAANVDQELAKIGAIIEKMGDPDIFIWLGRKEPPLSSRIASAALSRTPSSAMLKRSASSLRSRHGWRRAATSSWLQTQAPASMLCRLEPSASARMSPSNTQAREEAITFRSMRSS